MRQYTLRPDRRLLSLIDQTLPKLKYSLNFRKIIRWLENFSPDEVEQALEFLFFLEYIDYHELNSRINEQLENIFNQIPKVNKIIIFPGVAKYPKSAELINYIIKDTKIILENAERVIIIRDVDKITDKTTHTSFVLTDDFIGSGNSFAEGYDTKSKLKGWMDINPFIKERYLVSAIIMEEGMRFINTEYPEIKVFAEIRKKIFDPTTSPFLFKYSISDMKDLALKYSHVYRAAPLGYNNSESLISFCHTTPNNTLPIIWGSQGNWYPIFPRFSKDKISQSMEIKKEIAFYIGIMYRLGLHLFEDKIIELSNGKSINYDSKIHHSLVCIIKLLVDGYQKPSICQILGITSAEYQNIVDIGIFDKLFDTDGRLNSEGHDFYTRILKYVGQKARFIKNNREIFEMKNVLYVPKSFGGKT